MPCVKFLPMFSIFNMLNPPPSYNKISWNIEAARFRLRLSKSLWNLIGTSPALLYVKFPGDRIIITHNPRLRDFTRFGGRTSCHLVNRGPGLKNHLFCKVDIAENVSLCTHSNFSLCMTYCDNIRLHNVRSYGNLPPRYQTEVVDYDSVSGFVTEEKRIIHDPAWTPSPNITLGSRWKVMHMYAWVDISIYIYMIYITWIYIHDRPYYMPDGNYFFWATKLWYIMIDDTCEGHECSIDARHAPSRVESNAIHVWFFKTDE